MEAEPTFRIVGIRSWTRRGGEEWRKMVHLEEGSQPRTEMSSPACAFPHVVKVGGAKHAKPVHRQEAAWLEQAIPASSMALTHQCQVHG